MNYLQGKIFTNIDETISFIVELGEYLLEFIDKSCGEIFYKNIYIRKLRPNFWTRNWNTCWIIYARICYNYGYINMYGKFSKEVYKYNNSRNSYKLKLSIKTSSLFTF